MPGGSVNKVAPSGTKGQNHPPSMLYQIQYLYNRLSDG